MDTSLYDLDTCDLDELLVAIFEELENLENDAPEIYNKYWFNGEGDSNQTVYENLGCNLKICVLAKDETVARALHTFLRIIIDNHHRHKFINFLEDKKEYTITEMIHSFAKQNSNYSRVYDPNKNGVDASITLTGKNGQNINIRQYVGNIDTWDLRKIGIILGIWSVSDKYSSTK
jgi:hypothetical protein